MDLPSAEVDDLEIANLIYICVCDHLVLQLAFCVRMDKEKIIRKINILRERG